MDIDQEIINAVRDGIREVVKDKLSSGYNSPLDKMVSSALEKNNGLFRELLESATEGEEFTEELT